MLETSSGRFRSFSSRPDKGSLSHSHVLCITEDAQGRIWLVHEMVLTFDRESGTFKVLEKMTDFLTII